MMKLFQQGATLIAVVVVTCAVIVSAREIGFISVGNTHAFHRHSVAKRCDHQCWISSCSALTSITSRTYPAPPTDDTPTSHVCGPWCACGRRRTRLWASGEEGEDNVEEESAEEEQEDLEEPEEQKELSPEEKARNDLKAEIKDLESKLAKKRNELTEAQDRLKTVGKEGYMRLAAEVETYKRRRADGLNFVREEASKEALVQLVPVMDLFDEVGRKYADVKDESLLKVIGGYQNLQHVFTGKAEKLGLRAITPEVGDEFDSAKMTAEYIEGEKDNVIVGVLKKGYEISGRIVRPAEVQVSATKESLETMAEEVVQEENEDTEGDDSGEEKEEE